MNFFLEILNRISLESKEKKSLIGPEQAEVVRRMDALTDEYAPRLGMSRRQFLKAQMGLAVFFLSMNSVFGRFFSVLPAEAAGEGFAGKFPDQLIFDVQVHFVRSNYPSPGGLLSLRNRARDWNPDLKGGKPAPKDIMFDNFYREIFQKSQTGLAVLSNAPADRKDKWFLTNEEALAARKRVNDRAGKRVLLAHAVFTPGQPGWMEEMDKAIALKPDAWKGYTLGDPRGESKYPWRLDDEKLAYPAYEKMQKAGYRNVCIHKGLLPSGYERKMSPELISHAGVDDIGKAAQDWPDLNFIIYHSGIKKNLPGPEEVAEFRKTGRIPWVSDLAEIPRKFGVRNVYAEIGGAFAGTAIAHPELCAAMLGTLVRGMGADHICWGTDSIWYGSPQWQIEALRRIEIPESLQEKYGFAPLGPADGPVKTGIFSQNSARLYGI